VAGESSLDRFTDRAKVVVLKAQLEARSRGHHEVTSLHSSRSVCEWDGTPDARSRRGYGAVRLGSRSGGDCRRRGTDQPPCASQPG
jgi:hypothetical protein